MSTIFTPDYVPNGPLRGFTPHGIVRSLSTSESLDPAAWSEGVEFLGRTCPSRLNPYSHALCDVGPAKSTPVRVFDGLVEAEPHWFEKAVRCSTFGEPDLDMRAEAERVFEDSFELEIESAYCDLLLAAPPTPYAGPVSLNCAYGNAVAAASGVPGTGRGIIHVDPVVATWLYSKGLVEERNNKLRDPFGNLVVIWRMACGSGVIFVEVNAAVEIYLSDYIELPEAQDAIRSTNDRIFRLERGFVIARKTCEVFAVGYDCSL